MTISWLSAGVIHHSVLTEWNDYGDESRTTGRQNLLQFSRSAPSIGQQGPLVLRDNPCPHITDAVLPVLTGLRNCFIRHIARPLAR